MSSKADILNKTWTLFPTEEKDNCKFESNNVDEPMEVEVDIVEKNNPTNDYIKDDILDEEMFVDISPLRPVNQTHTKIPSFNQNKTINLNKTVDLNKTANKSPSLCLKENLNISYNYDLNRISIEMTNLINRFDLPKEDNFESLFEETINGIEFENGDPICSSNPSSPKLSIKENVNYETIDLEAKFDPLSFKTTEKTITKKISTVSLSSSLSASIENLDKFTTNDDLAFNPSSVPKTFDLFLNDLRKSSSTFTINSLSCANSHNNLALEQTSQNKQFSLSRRIMTSSIDKDLNKDFNNDNKLFNNRLSKLNKLSNLKEDANNTLMKTSSPLKFKSSSELLTKSKQQSNLIDKAPLLNTTIEIHKTANKPGNLNESLNDSEPSLSVSQSSSIMNFNLGQLNDEEPRTVFNTTYTSWSTNENQLQIEAFNQYQNQQRKQINSTLILNRTQDMNNNMNKDDLNKTKDIIHEDEIETYNHFNKTRDLSSKQTKHHNQNQILNLTQDLTTESSDKLSNLKQSMTNSLTNQLKRVSSLQNNRPSSIYQKSKLLIPKPTTSPKTENTNKLVKIPIVSNTLSKIVQPLATQNNDHIKLKIGIPRANVNTATSIPTKTSPVSSSQRPNTLTTKQLNSNTTNQQAAANLNRLSSTSSSSSASTSSSSSLKENKKSPLNIQISTSQIKSPTYTISKIQPINSLTKLKPPNFTSSSISGVTQPMNATTKTNIPHLNSNLPVVSKNDVNITQKTSVLKPPSQIPAFKVPTGIPTFRNTSNQIKK